MKKIFSLFVAMLFSVAMFANSYWYKGDNNSWGSSALTPSDDGFYEYIEGTLSGTHNFKILLEEDASWDDGLGYQYTDKGFNGTDIINMNSSSDSWSSTGDIKIYEDSKSYYILVYKPNTALNLTDDPKICASTTLPEEKFYVAGPKEDGWLTLNWNATDNTYKMTRTDNTCSITISGVTAGENTHKFKVSTYNWVQSWGYSLRDEDNSKNVVAFSDDSENLVFQAAKAGSITINFDLQTAKISVICEAPVITFDNEEGEGVASQNTYYNEAAVSVTPPTRDGYTFAGYYDGDNGTGNLVINASGVWQASVENFTDDDTKWIVRADQTLYAKWTQDPGASLAASKSESINVGEEITLTATATNCEPSKYEFYEGEVKKGEVVSTELTAEFAYTPLTVGAKTVKVVITHATGNIEATHDLALNTPAVALAVKEGSESGIYLDETTILVATPSNVGAGVTPKYVFTDQAETPVVSEEQTSTEWTYDPEVGGDKEMKVTMSVGGAEYTATTTVNVYEKWDILVKNNCNWANGIALYLFGNGQNADWPGVQGVGTGCEVYTGLWYQVTLDSKYPEFILNKNENGEQTVNCTTSKATYPENSLWEFDFNYEWDGTKYYNLVESSDTPTAIDEVEGAVKTVKRVVNGQLIIERDGKFFNALGTQVK